ncbi:amidohydrolase [Rhizobium laguerreae]|uniref:amidohydrolase n=1 Tax=Rhizobium laguerreae TaxID=1076926 RepID=UPI001C929415|nr:amidohydrolase [Rhizobium laguerreae]MBY3258793.1 amidohydrolase [Rhizobium laguerreae]MBY3282066.1 amidohydrolase [Rhizobium laguerreae]MBY3293356.1 amidohydrolase [Rhizobium laguerreae]
MPTTTNIAHHLVADRQKTYWELSDRVWDSPELNYKEFKSSKLHEDALRREGFAVSTGIGGLPTAIMGEAGSGGPIIAILGEFDALPGLEQSAGSLTPNEDANLGAGHGCGHNLLGAASLLAAVAVKNYLSSSNVQGRVRYYGCPAEEGGSGKAYLVRSGAFGDVDAAITWHPASYCGIANPVSLACNEIVFEFKGRSAHAAVCPHLGRSALDAVELMNVGVNYLREHIPSRARIHYAITDTGGHAPNVVQANAAVRYVVRGSDTNELRDLVERVFKVAEGAAMMTETTVKWRIVTGEANLLGNETLENLMFRCLQEYGAPKFDEADQAFAKDIQKTFPSGSVEGTVKCLNLRTSRNSALITDLVAPRSTDPSVAGSTDIGNVSWVVPTVEFRSTTHAMGTPAHSWQIVSQGKMPAAHKGLSHAAVIMAATAMELLLNPALLQKAKDEHLNLRRESDYVDPLPLAAVAEI